MGANSTYTLSIAGLDPSAGAGILADIKTFEAYNVIGFGICSAVTYQTEDKFLGLEWLSKEQIINQLVPLLEAYKIEAVKIGLIENLELLYGLLFKLKTHNPEIKIVWDPVLSASAGFTFHKGFQGETFINCLKMITLLTPNWPEAKKLGKHDALENVRALSNYTSVLLKGGHSEESHVEKHIVVDRLFQHSSEITFKTPRLADGKHGTGCVLSSAIAAGLARGMDLINACNDAKTYTHKFIKSRMGLLGSHHNTIS